MNDYYATLRIQQGRLKEAMQEMGIETSAELSRRCGVSKTEIGNLLNFKKSPRAKNGEWRLITTTICKTLAADPREIFPEHLDREIPTNQIASFVEHAQLSERQPLVLGPGDEYQQAETEQTINEVLKTLTNSEQNVLKSRFWGNKTLRQTGHEYNITRSRVGQIEARALRKLRHPSRLKKLEDVCMFRQ